MPIRHIPRVTPASLRAEGVFDVGRIPDTSIIFVMTEERLILLHSLTVVATFYDRAVRR